MYLSRQLAAPRGGTYYLGAPLSRRLVPRRLGHLGQPVSASGQAAVNASGQAGQIVKADGSAIYVPGTADCAASQSVVKPLLVSAAATAGGLLLKFGAHNPITLGIGAGLEAASLIFGAIFAHHVKAVGTEQSVLCAAVPAANHAIQVIDEGMQAGQFTPQQAIVGLDSVLSGFQSAVQPILKMDTQHCNAACVMILALKAAVAKRKQDYAALAQQQNVVIPAAKALLPVEAVQQIQSQITSAGLPSWLLPAAGFFLLYKLL